MAAEGGGVFRLRHVPRGDTGGFEDGQGPGRSYGSRQRCRPLRGEREPRAAAESSTEVGGARQRQARTAAEGEAPARREPQVDCGPCHGARGGETRAWGAARGRVGRVARETFAGRGGWRRTLTGTLWPRAPRPRVWAPCGRPQSRRGVERPEGQAGLQTERAGVRGSA